MCALLVALAISAYSAGASADQAIAPTITLPNTNDFVLSVGAGSDAVACGVSQAALLTAAQYPLANSRVRILRAAAYGHPNIRVDVQGLILRNDAWIYVVSWEVDAWEDVKLSWDTKTSSRSA